MSLPKPKAAIQTAPETRSAWLKGANCGPTIYVGLNENICSRQAEYVGKPTLAQFQIRAEMSANG